MKLEIKRLDPSSVKVNWEGTLTIHGMDFGERGFVTIDGTYAKIESWTAALIKVEIKKELTATAGKKKLLVSDKDCNQDKTEWRVED
ncbi:MAG: hypothetical protein L0Y71_17040 [Gemmataceae bacterium]|nr:hypothetical protein [Gemmataceae bacterium]